MASERPGRGSDQFPLRLPDGLRQRIKAVATLNKRSMNQEIVDRLEATFDQDEWSMEGLDYRDMIEQAEHLGSRAKAKDFDEHIKIVQETMQREIQQLRAHFDQQMKDYRNNMNAKE